MRKAASSQPPGSEPVSVSGVMNTEPTPEDQEQDHLSHEERRQMLDVLQHDAAQVEDVVMELREFLAEMEIKYEAIVSHVSDLNAAYNATTAAYHILEGVGSRLPSYIIASQDFRLRWEDTKSLIHTQLSDLESMRLFYENYLSSYDSLILEVYRRKEAEGKIKGIVEKAMEQVGKIYEADKREREGFRIDVGEYLPVDLYEGVNDSAPRWEIVLGEGKVPNLERDRVEEAERRERERRKGER